MPDVPGDLVAGELRRSTWALWAERYSPLIGVGHNRWKSIKSSLQKTKMYPHVSLLLQHLIVSEEPNDFSLATGLRDKAV